MRNLKINVAHSLTAVSFVATLFATSACTKSENNVTRGTREQVLHYGNGAEPSDLDPQTTTGVPEADIHNALFEGLTESDPKTLAPIPGVAETWAVSKDQKNYVFKIRANAAWSNGDKLTAKDFVYSWQRILTPELGAEYAYMLYYLDGAEEFNKGTLKDFSKVGVRAKDDYTLEVKLKAPTPFFLSLLTHHSTFPVHQATIEKFGKMAEKGSKWTRPGNMVSNGPFKLAQWDMNKVVATVKNPNFWDAKNVKLNGISFYPTESQQTEEKLFRSGDLHVTHEVPLTKIDTYKKEHPEFIKIEPYAGTYFYRLNTTQKPFNDVRVRRALALSIDRQAIVEKVTKGGQLPAESITPPGLGGYYPKAKVGQDLVIAKKLLAEAGYPNGQGFPKTEVLFNSSEAHKVIAEAVQQMWKKNLGIDVALANQDWKVYLDSQKSLNYQICRAAWIGDYVDPNSFLDMFVTKGGNNNTGWGNKKYDDLIRQAGMTGDMNKRFEYFQQAEKILADEAPVIPVYTYTRVYLLHPDVKGWYPTITDMHNYKYVYLDSGTSGQTVGSR